MTHPIPDIHELLRSRWSPYAFAPAALPDDAALRLLEAARWAPSSYNEQPWAFIVAAREDSAEFEALLSCLVPANQAWARNAGLLLLTVASLKFRHNSRPNRHAWHDVGLAVAQLTVQATAMGLRVHQMAGIDAERAREQYEIPESWEPVTAVAVGRPGRPESLPAEVAARDAERRPRKALEEFVFAEAFGQSAPWLST